MAPLWIKDEQRYESIPLRATALLKVIPSLRYYFVSGAPCIMEYNVSPLEGLANGTTGICHSLTFSSSERDWFNFPPTFAPGQLLEVPEPESINITVYCGPRELSRGVQRLLLEKNAHPRLPDETDYAHRKRLEGTVRLASARVIPIRQERRNHESWERGVQKVTGYRGFQWTLAFAITFFKIQGLTLDRLVLFLTKCQSKRIMPVKASDIVVGFTRVKKGSHIRVWPHSPDGLRYLTKLPRRNNLSKWDGNYTKPLGGKWQYGGFNAVTVKEKKEAMALLLGIDHLGHVSNEHLKRLISVLGVPTVPGS